MSEMSKKAREALKAKARRLAAPGTLEKDQNTTQADWTPAEALNADVKTGARPVGKARLYKKGGKVIGKVAGEKGAFRADRKPRKSGGRALEKEIGVGMANKDVREANEQREGIKHVGAFKKGGKAKRATGGSIPSAKETEYNKQRLGTMKIKPERGAAGHYKKGGKIKKAGGGELPPPEEGMRSEERLKGIKVQKAPAQGFSKAQQQSYEREEGYAAADRAAGRKHGGKAEDRKGRKTGGRTGRHKRGQTHINIVIAAGKEKQKPELPPDLGALPPDMGAMPMPPAGAGATPPPPPAGAGAPMPMPAMPPINISTDRGRDRELLGRKAGGRITKVAKSYKDMEAGAASGEGRLQKTDIEKRGTDAPARKAGGRIYRSYKDMDAGAGSGVGREEKTEIQKHKKVRGK